MSTYKFMDSDTLAELNQRAVKANYNRALTDEFIAKLDPDGVHLVTMVMPHEHAQGVRVEPHYRCQVFAKTIDRDADHPAEVWLDISDGDYWALGTVDEQGNVKAGIGVFGSGKRANHDVRRHHYER